MHNLDVALPPAILKLGKLYCLYLLEEFIMIHSLGLRIQNYSISF